MNALVRDQPFLRFSDIFAIKDPQEVLDLQEYLEIEAARIEAQLDFSTADDTDTWEGRAIAALGAKRAQIGACRRHHEKLTKTTKPAPVIDTEKIALRREHHAQELERQQINADIKKAHIQQNMQNQRISALREILKAKRQFHRDIYVARAAKRFLTLEQLQQCDAEADAALAEQFSELEAEIRSLRA